MRCAVPDAVQNKANDQKNTHAGECFFLLYRKLRFRKAKKIICPAECPLRVLGDGRIENGRRVTATVFLCSVHSTTALFSR